MNQRSILLICALLAAASSLATCQNRINFKYVDFSSLKLDRHFAIKDQETNQILTLIGNLPPADVDTTLNMYHENIQSISELRGLTPRQELMAHNLWFLGTEELEFEIFEGLVDSLMYVCFRISTTDYPNLIRFDDYLRINAQSKFATFLSGSVEALSSPGDSNNINALDGLDRAFGVHSTPNRQLTIEQKLETLRNFDMGNFSRERAIHIGNRGNMVEGDPLKRFFIAMYNHCQYLRSDREFHFNVIGLARSFGVTQGNMPHQVEILMEYNRLCASAATDATRRAIRGD